MKKIDETDRLVEALLDCFNQACGEYDQKTGKTTYDHMCLSAYEQAQDLLIERGVIKESECKRT